MKPGDTISLDFTTHLATGGFSNADALPTGVLIRNGTDTAEVVTVTNKAVGQYNAAATIPVGYAAGDLVQVRIACTVAAVAGGGIIWSNQLDTKRVSDLHDVAAGDAMTLTGGYDPAKTAAQAGDAMTLTAAERNALNAALGAEGLTLVEALSLLLASHAGNLNRNGTEFAFRDLADAVNRIIGTVDSDGNRVVTERNV